MDGKETLKRCLKMMILLSRYNGKTSVELADYFNVSIRTIQRDILKIQDVGFIVEKEKDRYKINMDQTKSISGFDVRNLTQFTKEEAYVLTEAIKNIDGLDPIKENIIKKLSAINNIDILFKNLNSLDGHEDVNVLAHAISKGYSVVVDEYTWMSENKGLNSVLIEPIQFASNYSRIWAYYPKDKRNLLLRLSGIANVKPTYEKYKHAQHHKIGFIDVFYGYGFKKTNVTLILNKRAYGILLEEFPKAASIVEEINKVQYKLETEVYDLFPVGRFCMGLNYDIKIIDSEELKKHINRIKNSNRTFYPWAMKRVVSNPYRDY